MRRGGGGGGSQWVRRHPCSPKRFSPSWRRFPEYVVLPLRAVPTDKTSSGTPPVAGPRWLSCDGGSRQRGDLTPP